MLEGKAMVKDSDMEEKLKSHAMSCASQALDLYDVTDLVAIAAHIKKVILHGHQSMHESILVMDCICSFSFA